MTSVFRRPLCRRAAIVLLLAFGVLPRPAAACDTALLLMVDISNSVDAGEYAIQMRGIAAALRDPAISEALVLGNSSLALMQWSGPGMHSVQIDWTRIVGPGVLAILADRIETMPRAFAGANTALGSAVSTGVEQFGPVGDCARWIIDVSGDGAENAGTDVGRARREAERRGVTVNGLAIEGLGVAISRYFRDTLITGDGFVETARGYGDFPRAIRVKIRREISRLSG